MVFMITQKAPESTIPKTEVTDQALPDAEE
jgi:hypothetical protein